MNIRRFLGVILLSFLLFSVFPSRVFAQVPPIIVGANLNAYVPPTGVECNINVPSQYPTIQAGIDAAIDGDTVCVGPGTYNQNVIVGKSIKLSGRGAAQTTINGQITNEVPGYYTVIIAGANNTIIEGFRMNGVGGANNTTVMLTDSSLDGVNLRYNWIVAGDRAIPVREDGASINTLVQNNVLEGNNSLSIGYVGAGDRDNFLNNTFIGTASYALFEASSNNLIEGNAFHINGNSRVRVFAHWTSIINENNLNGNVDNTYLPEGTMNAENNWWGDTDPANNIIGDVDYIPFATSPFLEYPVPVLNQPPVANAGIDQTSNEGVSISFDGSLSTDPDGTGDIISYAWNFGDGATASGQVQFGVTSKYLDSAIIGDVSMNFRAANLEFDATTLTVLVTSNGQATLRGTGTINGSGNYNFLVTGLDGFQDAVRFQIKDQSGTVIYDSQPGAVDTAAPTASVTGQIIVH